MFKKQGKVNNVMNSGGTKGTWQKMLKVSHFQQKNFATSNTFCSPSAPFQHTPTHTPTPHTHTHTPFSAATTGHKNKPKEGKHKQFSLYILFNRLDSSFTSIIKKKLMHFVLTLCLPKIFMICCLVCLFGRWFIIILSPNKYKQTFNKYVLN